ncbi:MAG: hypothetical protein ABIJ28_02475, partial [Patescibacteria group bacterium]
MPKDSGEIVKKSVITKWLHAGAWSQQNPAHQISQNLLDGSSEVSRIVKVCANKIFKASNQFANIVVKNIFNPLANSGESIGNEMLKVAQNFGETIFNTLMPWTKYYSDTQDAIMKLAKRKSGLTTLVYQGDYVVQQTPGQPVDSTGKDVIVIKGQKGQSGEKGDVGEKGERGEQGLQGLAGQSGDTFVSNIYNVGSPGTTAKQGAGTVFDAKYLGASELSVSAGTSLNTLTVGGAASFESSVSIAGGLTASSGLSTSNISGSGYLSIGNGTSDWALEVGDGYFSDDLEVDGSLRVDSATTTGVALLVTSSTAIPQITARYDTDHQWQSSVDNKGNLVWNLTSATNTPEFTFSDPVNISTSIPLGIDVFDITASTTQSIIDIKSSSTDYLIKVDQMGDGGIFDFKQSELSVLSLSNAGVLNLQNASSTQSIFSLTASSSAPLVVFDQKGAGSSLLFGSSPQASSTISLLQLTANPMTLGSVNGTFIAANPASFSGNFMDFQVAGTRYFSLASDGDIFTAGGFLMSVNSTTAVSIQDTTGVTHFVIDTTQGHYGFATSSPADGFGLTIATSTLQYGDYYNFGNATTTGTGVFFVSLSVATTTHPYGLNVSGSGYFTDGLMVAGYTTTSDLYVQGNATTTGSHYIGGDLSVQDDVHIDGQCVTGDTVLPIVRVNNIEYVRIDEIKGGEYVMSLNEKTGLLEPARINGLLDMGVKPIYKLTTESGKTIRTTGNHPYLVKSEIQIENQSFFVTEGFIKENKIAQNKQDNTHYDVENNISHNNLVFLSFANDQIANNQQNTKNYISNNEIIHSFSGGVILSPYARQNKAKNVPPKKVGKFIAPPIVSGTKNPTNTEATNSFDRSIRKSENLSNWVSDHFGLSALASDFIEFSSLISEVGFSGNEFSRLELLDKFSDIKINYPQDNNSIENIENANWTKVAYLSEGDEIAVS